MATVHWCGTGLSAGPGLRRLIQSGHDVVVWNRTVENARRTIGDLAADIREFSAGGVKAALGKGDVAVSMLPGEWHAPLASAAIERGAGFVSSSYISAEMLGLDSSARDAGVCLVNEVGLDPGIDHALAHWLVADYRASGLAKPGSEHFFTSYCGGVPLNPNPFKYKFSWSPYGVLKALRSPSLSISKGRQLVVGKPWDAISTYVAPLSPPESFEVYPNRDSIPFIKEYGFDPGWNLQQFARGTLRLNGWAEAWKGLFADLEALGEEEAESALREMSSRLWAENAYGEDDPDRVVLCVSLRAEAGGTPVYHKTWTLDAFGTSESTAMARLVSVPVSLAVESVLAGEVSPGVSAAPSAPAAVERWLREVRGLAQHFELVDHCAQSAA